MPSHIRRLNIPISVDEIEGNGFAVDLITVEFDAVFSYDKSFCFLNELLGATQKDLLV